MAPARHFDHITFVERVVVAEGAMPIGDVLHATALRLERETHGAAGSVRIHGVRRMTASEVAHLRLEASAGVWFELWGEVTRARGVT
jgi:hypothetical protein